MSDADLFVLGPAELHVWSIALELDAAAAARCAAVLSVDERARAAAFRFDLHRRHYIAAHGRLRELLAGYVGVAAADLRFECGEFGKPRLVPRDDAGLEFNLSHSHGHALVAIARGCAVGVDLERIRAETDCAMIVASHFSPAERAAWNAFPEPRRAEAFFHGWARKEAYVKARGEGLSHEPSRYTIDINPDGAGALLEDTLAPDAPDTWTVRAVAAPPGFAAAVAHAGAPRVIRQRS